MDRSLIVFFFFPIVLFAVSGSRRMASIWLRAVIVQHKYMIQRRVRKPGVYILLFFFLSCLLLYLIAFITIFSLRYFHELTRFFKLTHKPFFFFFSHTIVFWQMNLLVNRVIYMYGVFVSVLMANTWLLARTISRSEYVVFLTIGAE